MKSARSSALGVIPKPAAQKTGKKVAVVGSGISGLGAAWALSKAGHQVTLLESGPYFGGHTNTVDVEIEGEGIAPEHLFILLREGRLLATSPIAPDDPWGKRMKPAMLALAAGGSLEEASVLGNLAAGVEVGKRGTATVSPEEVVVAMEFFANWPTSLGADSG